MILQMRFFSWKMIFQVLLCLDESLKSWKMQNYDCGWSAMVIWEKGLKMKGHLVKWVYEYVITGKDRNIRLLTQTQTRFTVAEKSD